MLEAVDLSKCFPGVQALSGVSLALRPGEIVSVVGENGAGKSTLMKILAGVQRPDAGTLRLDGRNVDFKTVDEAQRAGISLIHQELNLAESLDVAANVFLGREPTVGGPLGLIAPRIYRETADVARRLGLECSPRARVDSLSLGERQLVEIAKALSFRSRFIIFDEPTSSLTDRETRKLFDVIRSLKADGVGVLYISHRLAEVGEISDRVVVLRDGCNAGELARDEISHEALVRRMVGRELRQFFHHSPRAVDREAPPLLSVRDLRNDAAPDRSVSFDLRAGEIVGMAGLMGAGRTEMAETLFGLRRRTGGEVLLNGKPVAPKTPAEAVAAGILLVPEDRRLQGLVIDFSIRDNISLPSLERLQRAKLVSIGAENNLAESMRTKLGIRAPHIHQIVGLLSGGNQQKVVLAKWLARSPKVLILDEPTRGVDVGAKSEIYALMDELARNGTAVLMISSDLEEVLGVSDRVLVMHEHRLAGELSRSELSEEAVMHLATGGTNGR